MKKIFATILCGIIFTVNTEVFSQEANTPIGNPFESDSYSYTSDEYIGIQHDIPIIRKINGGTIIKVNYVGNWTNEMKGAFEYACKIWEEALPNSLPLMITAKIENIRSTGTAPMSKVTSLGYNIQDNINNEFISLSSQIKHVLLREHHSQGNRQFYTELPDSVFYNTPDITITYNKSRIKELDFSLDPTPSSKYDFVTLALRDIAKGLGIYCDCYVSGGKLLFRNQFPTKFESNIQYFLGEDPLAALKNACQDSLRIGDLNLYAPSEWQQGLSLNSTIPDTTYKLNQLLSHDFGRGMVFRDLGADKIATLFELYLGWYPLLTIGIGNQGSISNGMTSNFIPYGDYSFYPDENGTIQSVMQSVSRFGRIASFSHSPIENVYKTDYSDWHDMISLSDYGYQNWFPEGDSKSKGYHFSILKKDGSWDTVDIHSDFSMPFITSQFEYHYPLEDYARSPEGYLRGRLSYTGSYFNPSTGSYMYGHKVSFYVVDCLPQKIEMAYSGLNDSDAPLQVQSKQTIEDDEYLREIKIGIKNIEGAEKVIVEQQDEFDYVPFMYEVQDFKKGYFTAIVDKEFSSTFTVTAYNKNGTTKSDVFVLPPLEPLDESIDVKILNNEIQVNVSRSNRRPANMVIKYEIAKFDTYDISVKKSGTLVDNNVVSIDDLPNGIYVLRYTINGKTGTKKFQIQ